VSAVIRTEQVLPVAQKPLRIGLRWVVGILGLLLVLLGGLYVSEIATDPARFPVLNVDVNGTLDYTDREALSQRIQAHTQLGFYGMDVDAIRQSIEQMPWVSQAHIRRVWPGRLMVTVEEHEPAARYNDDALVSKSLELFKPPQLHKDNPQYNDWRKNLSTLPRLAGAAGRHEFVLDAFRRYELSLSQFGVAVQALNEDERRSQTLILSNGVTVKIGYEAHELRLQRFIDVYERLVTPLNGRGAKFDMRYSNGFAMSTGGLIGGTN